MSVLHEAAQTHPNTWWWLKADGCDLVSGLMESTTLKWNGDVDLNDGKLQEQYRLYRQRLEFIRGLGLSGRTRTHRDIQDVSQDIKDDLEFVHTGWCLGIALLVVIFCPFT